MDVLKENQLLRARIADIKKLSERRGKPVFSDFLDVRGRRIAEEVAGANATFFGGFEGAERVMFCFSPFFVAPERYPITAVQVVTGGYRALTHRDYLGTLMALGITREKLGDIVVSENNAILFLDSHIAKFVCTNLNKVGGEGAKAEQLSEFPQIDRSVLFEKKSGVIASARFDCVVGELANRARGKAALIIEGGQALLNAMESNKAALVKEGDIISIRGVGKFRIGDLSGRTKKGNIIICYEQYK